MKLLDLFCGAGGSAVGYNRVGFDEIVGVDNRPMPRYPFAFVLGDALEYVREHGHEFDAIHASPPCQEYSTLASLKNGDYPKLIEPVREALVATGKPYVIENVKGAPLVNPLTLCGSMFGLRVQRHRLFECNPVIWFPPHPCNHWGKASGGRNFTGIRKTLENFSFLTIAGNDYIVGDGRRAMSIDWMTRTELSQAIPPAYTEHIGKFLMSIICGTVAIGGG